MGRWKLENVKQLGLGGWEEALLGSILWKCCEYLHHSPFQCEVTEHRVVKQCTQLVLLGLGKPSFPQGGRTITELLHV